MLKHLSGSASGAEKMERYLEWNIAEPAKVGDFSYSAQRKSAIFQALPFYVTYLMVPKIRSPASPNPGQI